MTMDLQLKITSVRAEALDVISLELRREDNAMLPRFKPGAHLEVVVHPRSPGGSALLRHYSLCNDSTEKDRYVFAVARQPDGRGGSEALHDQAHIGMGITVRGPRNNFALVEHASFYRFIAGGIGITPLLSMIRWCERNGKPWTLLYCARSRVRAAFYEVLKGYGSNVSYHFDDECGGHLTDLDGELSHPVAGEHVYCCGPNPLMRAVEQRCETRDSGTVHFEWFSAPALPIAEKAKSGTFDVVLRKSGVRFSVPENKSILDVLEDNGIAVPFSCREGICRSCETPLCSGEVDHRDYALSRDEQDANRSIIICVSRARSGVLELDI